jgi:hypothetical protein
VVVGILRRVGAVALSVTVLGAASLGMSTRAIATQAAEPQGGRALLSEINAQLAAQDAPYRLEAVDFLTLGGGLSPIRVHRFPLRWVPNDPRRYFDAPGEDLTYIFDQSDGATSSGLTALQTEAAFDEAIATWAADSCLRNFNIVKHPDLGIDPDIEDYFLGVGGFGTPTADVIFAGFAPQQLFDAWAPGANVIAFSFTFVFVDATGTPTDIDHNNYLDSALSEIYFNDAFGNANVPAPWGIDVPLQVGIDFESVALHEFGHSLGLGHFGGPPVAVMNGNESFWLNLSQSLYPPDHGSICAQLGSWPQ